MATLFTASATAVDELLVSVEVFTSGSAAAGGVAGGVVPGEQKPFNPHT
jgi:hypothetical protein